MPIRNVTIGQQGRRFQRRIRHLHAVVLLVAPPQPFENFHGFRRRGCVHLHRLETTGQGFIPFDVLAILV